MFTEDFSILPISIKLMIIGQTYQTADKEISCEEIGKILSNEPIDPENAVRSCFGYFRGDSDRTPYLLFFQHRFAFMMFPNGIRYWHYFDAKVHDGNYHVKFTKKGNWTFRMDDHDYSHNVGIFNKVLEQNPNNKLILWHRHESVFDAYYHPNCYHVLNFYQIGDDIPQQVINRVIGVKFSLGLSYRNVEKCKMFPLLRDFYTFDSSDRHYLQPGQRLIVTLKLF